MTAAGAGPPARTQVGIIGAGPAGLFLAALLRRAGVESVILEARTRAYVEQRIRAGVLEQGTADLLTELGAGERLARESMRHHGFEIRFERERHLVPLVELTGYPMIVYGQQEIVKDLIALHLAAGQQLLFEAPAEAVDGATERTPVIRYRSRERQRELRCDAVVAADGSHGIGHDTIPSSLMRVTEHDFPFAWLGIVAEVAPSTEVVIYANSADGLGMHSMRSPSLSRLYVQCDARDTLRDWPDDRIWAALHRRLATDDGWELAEGPIVQRGIAPIRCSVAEPMRHGRLFLAGDAAHIVPPAGAKGLNLAVRDVIVLADALTAWLRDGDPAAADAYSQTCLRHVWWAQYFSCYLTRLVHAGGGGAIDRELQLAELRHLVRSDSAMRTLAENYVGLGAPGPAGGGPREARPGVRRRPTGPGRSSG